MVPLVLKECVVSNEAGDASPPARPILQDAQADI